MLDFGASAQRITQRLHGITSVIQAMLLGSGRLASPFFCSGTTSKSAFTD